MSLHQTTLFVALQINILAINKLRSAALGFRAILYAIDVELLTELGLCRLKGLKIAFFSDTHYLQLKSIKNKNSDYIRTKYLLKA